MIPIKLKINLIWILSCIVTHTFAQHTNIDISLKNQSLKNFIETIETKTDYTFMLDQSIDPAKQITVELKQATIRAILDKAFSGTDIRYEIVNRQIILKMAPKTQSKGEKMVTGTITDEQGEPIIGANIIEKGTTNGNVTNIDGYFSLNVSNNATLEISYIGYTAQSIPVRDRSVIHVVLKEDLQLLDEVVVVGYGVQKKVNLIGSVASVNFTEQAESRPITNISGALAGLSSGVSVLQESGEPGKDGATIRIRGLGTLNNSAPLVIIDGMEGDMNILNPNDIESVSILKDAASASIYGSRAANGVVLITTKKGGKDRVQVHYSGNISLASPSNLVDMVSDYPQYMRLMNESNQNVGYPSIFSDRTIQAWEEANKNPNASNELGIPNRIAYPNTNWQKEMYGNNLIHNHTLSVDGGTAKTSFLLSLGYMDNSGLVENTGIKRYTFRANVSTEVTDWLTVGTNTYGTLQSKEMGDYSSMNSYISGASPGMIGKWNGKYGFPEAAEESTQTDNVYTFLNRYSGQDESMRINTTVFSKVKFLNDFSWDFNFNYNRRFDEYNRHHNANERIQFSTGEVKTQATDPSLMTTYYKNGGNYSYTLENLLRYNKTIHNVHDIGVLAGYNEYYYKEYTHESTKQGLVDPTISTPSSATEMIEIKGTAKDHALRSFFGRINYAYDSRYLFEANIRYDGSSRFASDTRWGIFPSFAAAWRITEEDFMKEQDLLQNLKLRLSWGELGNNATDGEYDYQAVYGTVRYPLNDKIYTGLRPNKISNYALKWETTRVFNIGVDAALLNSRLTAELDVYHKVTSGILTTPPIYMTAGNKTAPTQNTAEVTNKGLELTVGWRDRIGEVSYGISGNFAYNHNEVTKYKGVLKEGWTTNEKGERVWTSNIGSVSDTRDQRRVLEGHLINEYYLLTTYTGNQTYFNSDGSVNINGGPKDGMIRTEDDMRWIQAMMDAGYTFMPNRELGKNQLWYGDLIYADLNGDGIYGSSYDYQFTGTSTTPKYNFGLNLSAAWRQFDLSMIWAGSAGFDLYWAQFGFNVSSTGYGSAIGQRVADNHYFYNEGNSEISTPNNLNGKYPRLRPSDNDSQNRQSSTFYLYNGNFLKLKNLSLGYTLPAQWSKKVFADRIRVYFSGENLFTITSFPGQDPEIGGSIGYPSLKQISFGANITF